MLKIRELREEAQMTQKQLADKISNMQRNISNWEQGVSEPDLKTVVALADTFNVSLDELFGRNTDILTVSENADTKLIKEIRKLDPIQKSALYDLIKSFK